MSKSAFLITCAMCVLPLHAATHHSSEFGWKANQDVSQAFAKLLADGTLKAGDELVLDHTYRISGSYELPDKVTLSAVKGGGFDVVDGKARGTFLTLGNGNTLRNLTIKYLDTPPVGPTGEKRGVNFTERIGIVASGKSGLLIENCEMIGAIGHQLRLVDCSKVQIIGCHIAGGHWSTYLVAVNDITFQRCLIEKCQGDGIKTGGTGKAVKNALVENCVFQDNLRDGIDLTGGFNNSVVRNSIFRRLGVSGMDMKAHYESKTGKLDDGQEPENVGITVENCTFLDMPNAFVLTTLDRDRLLNAVNIKAYAPHDINIIDCVIGHVETPLRTTREGGYGVNYPSDQGEYMRMIHLKDAYDVHYKNIVLLGERILTTRIGSLGGSRHLSKEAAEAFEHTVTGNILDKPAPPIKPGVTEVPFACGPR